MEVNTYMKNILLSLGAIAVMGLFAVNAAFAQTTTPMPTTTTTANTTTNTTSNTTVPEGAPSTGMGYFSR